MEETWRPVVGHEGYEVSDLGWVRSLDREVIAPTRWGGECVRRGGAATTEARRARGHAARLR